MNADFGKRVMEDMREVIAVATGLIERVVAEIAANETDGSEVSTQLPPAGTPSDETSKEWLPEGFSRVTNEDGLVRVRAVDEFLAKIPRDHPAYVNNFDLFHFHDAYYKADHPTLNARLKHSRALSNRLWGVPMGEFTYEVEAVTITTIVGSPFDFYKAPESRITTKWERHGFIPRAASSNWDPSTNAAWALELVKTIATREGWAA